MEDEGNRDLFFAYIDALISASKDKDHADPIFEQIEQACSLASIALIQIIKNAGNITTKVEEIIKNICEMCNSYTGELLKNTREITEKIRDKLNGKEEIMLLDPDIKHN